MTYDDLVSHFKTPSDAARALEVDRRLVDLWKKRRIPTKHQLKAEALSKGELSPDAEAVAEAAEMAALLQTVARAA